MSEMKLALNAESVEALRNFAASMPVVLENITNDTNHLIQIYNSVAETVGPHAQDFSNMLMHIKKAQEDAKDAINLLPKELEKTASKMEDYLAKHPNASV